MRMYRETREAVVIGQCKVVLMLMNVKGTPKPKVVQDL